MTTAANVKTTNAGHWYGQDGTPAYTVIAKGTGLPRSTTLRDARQLNLLPSVTTILRLLHKQALVEWLCEQTALAILTTPRLPGEADDAFVERVLHTERVQDEESQKARDRGTEIHDAMEEFFNKGKLMGSEIWQWIGPACVAIRDRFGAVVATEKILVGDGYAGKTDLIQKIDGEEGGGWILWDFKSSRKLPDLKKGGAYPENRLQLSAYAKAYSRVAGGPIKTANLYISTVDQGKFVICEHEEWSSTYENGFAPLLKHWQWSTGYTPTTQPKTWDS